jgi:hypothetical protein
MLTRRGSWLSVALVVCVASGCPKDEKTGGGSSGEQDGGQSATRMGTGGSRSAGSKGDYRDGGGQVTLADAGGGGKGGGSQSTDAGARGGGGTSGGGASQDAGSSSGTGTSDGGAASGGTASGGCKIGGCSAELCTDAKDNAISTCIWRDEYACYKNATCARQANGMCGWTATPQLQQCIASAGGGSGGASGGGGALKWYLTCGTPVCTANPAPYDDPNIPNCTKDQTAGAACNTKDQHCDGVASCGATLVCTDTDPKGGIGGCPISRARYKQEIEYLNEQQLRAYHEQLMSLPLASYRYRSAPETPQLGFIIDDIEPSVAVSGDHVNMYGYLSMAVAAIQVQQRQIESLEQEVARLREQVATQPAGVNDTAPALRGGASMCTP